MAGVALKYGISVAELRRANQLWSSDSIHLRKVLYIPLDKAKHHLPDLIDLRDSTPTDSTITPTSQLNSNFSTIRRIPASKLSFFPPASSQPKQSRRTQSHDISQHTRTISTPSSYPSVFTPLVSRLSFESTTSSDDADQEHELDDVRRSPSKSRAKFVSASSRVGDRRPMRPTLSGDLFTLDDKVTTNDKSPVTPTRIRTMQPEPQPDMLIPKSREKALRMKTPQSSQAPVL